MKKITLPILLLVLAAASHAQFSKGDKYLGGVVAIHVSENEYSTSGNKSFSATLAPSFTRFKSERRASGFKLAAGYYKSKFGIPGNPSEISGWNFGAGLLWQRYLLLGKGFYLVGEYGFNGTYGTRNTSQTNTSFSSDSESYGVNFYLTPGFGYKISNRLLMGLSFSNVALIHYTHEKNTDNNGGIISKTSNNNYGFSSSVNTYALSNLGLNFAWKLK